MACMDDSQSQLFEAIAREADELLDQDETALEEHAQFSMMLATRTRVDDLSRRYREACNAADAKDRMQIERSVGRKVVDLQKMSNRLPAQAVGKAAEKSADTGMMERRAPTSSRPPITIGEA